MIIEYYIRKDTVIMAEGNPPDVGENVFLHELVGDLATKKKYKVVKRNFVLSQPPPHIFTGTYNHKVVVKLKEAT